MNIALVLALLGITGALLDLALHFLQLFPRFEPSLRFTSILTLVSALLIVLSCVCAFNWAALIMAIGIGAMAAVSLVTGKEVH